MSREPIELERLRRQLPSAFAAAAHDSRSERYAFIPTCVVLEGLGREGFLPFAAMQQGRGVEKREHTRHLIRFRHPALAAVALGDVIPEIVLVNSHDGTSSYRLMAGLFRLVCLNGLVVSQSTCADVTIRHSGKNIVEKVIEGAYAVLDSTKLAIAASAKFRAIALSDDEQRAFGKAAAALRWGEDEAIPVTPTEVVRPRRYADCDPNLWATLNVAQENLLRGGLHGTNRRANRRATTRAVTGVAENVRLNRGLWTLAEEMADIKTRRTTTRAVTGVTETVSRALWTLAEEMAKLRAA